MQMANMLEGGGKTPILSPEQLEQLGFKLVGLDACLVGWLPALVGFKLVD